MQEDWNVLSSSIASSFEVKNRTKDLSVGHQKDRPDEEKTIRLENLLSIIRARKCICKISIRSMRKEYLSKCKNKLRWYAHKKYNVIVARS